MTPAPMVTTPYQQAFEFFEPCEHDGDAPQFDCKHCGRIFCSSCEGSDHASDLCDGCFDELGHGDHCIAYVDGVLTATCEASQ